MSTPQPPEVPIRRVARVDWMDPPPPNPPALPVPVVDGACAVLDNKRALHIGGYCPSTGHSTAAVAALDLTLRVWSAAGVPQLPRALSECGVANIGGSVYVYGGWDDATVTGDVYALVPAAGGELKGTAWTRVYTAGTTALEPTPRRGPSVAAGTLAGRSVFFVFGGYDGRRRLQDLWAFDVSSQVWIEVSGAAAGGGSLPPPSPRDGAALAFEPLQQRLLLFGGYVSGPTNDVFELRLEGLGVGPADEQACFRATGVVAWTRLTTVKPPLPRYGCWAVVCGQYLVVGNGRDAQGPSRLLFQLHLADYHWTVCTIDTEQPLEARAGAAVGVAPDGRRVVIVGGTTGDGRYLCSALDVEMDRAEAPAKGRR